MNLKRMNGLLEAVKVQMAEADSGFERQQRDAAKNAKKYEKAHNQFLMHWRGMSEALAQMQFAAGDSGDRDLHRRIKSYRDSLEQMMFPDRPKVG